MSGNGTIGGKPPVDRICRNCEDWVFGGQCKLWKNYKYALTKACGYFTPRDDGQQAAQTKP